MLCPLSYRRSLPAYRGGPALHECGAPSTCPRSPAQLPVEARQSSSPDPSSWTTTTERPGLGIGRRRFVDRLECDPGPTVRPRLRDEPHRLSADLLSGEDVSEGRCSRSGEQEHAAHRLMIAVCVRYQHDRMGHMIHTVNGIGRSLRSNVTSLRPRCERVIGTCTYRRCWWALPDFLLLLRHVGSIADG